MDLKATHDWIAYLTFWARGRGRALAVILPDLRRSEWYAVAEMAFHASGPSEVVEQHLGRVLAELGTETPALWRACS
jgi:hypothetical protein